MSKSSTWIVALGALVAAAGIAVAGTAGAHSGFGHHGGPFRMVMHEMLGGIDTNNDHALSQDEVNAAVAARYSRFDANKDGKLSLEEFQSLWSDLTRPLAVRAFQFLDPDGDAAVARAEVDQRFGALVARFDRNNDGKLSPEDRPHRRWGRGPESSE
ncbi:MAG TPA: hypothetical protein VIB38_12435 [Aestuariivirgaceae bacterium]